MSEKAMSEKAMSEQAASEKRAIIVGASAGVGLAIAEGLAVDGWDLVIGSRSQSDLDALVSPLVEAGAKSITPIAVDVADDDSLTHFIEQAGDGASAVIITAGSVAAIDEGTSDWATISSLVTNNMTGVMKLAGHYAFEFESADAGTLVLFSSIAAGAPRRNNVAYAAAKAGLESFAGSMQHRLGRSGAAVHLYRLGYVDTRLAQGDLKLKPADPKKVAARVISGIGGRSRSVFEPRYWSPIVRGLRILPPPIYNRLDF